jgi:hypothetical protein
LGLACSVWLLGWEVEAFEEGVRLGGEGQSDGEEGGALHGDELVSWMRFQASVLQLGKNDRLIDNNNAEGTSSRRVMT